MKTLRVVAILAISGLFGLSSCSKKGDDVTPAPTQTSTTPTTSTTPPTTTTLATTGFYTKIDGKEYRPDLVFAKVAVPGNDGYYGIYGLDSKTADLVYVQLPYSAAVAGTYKLSYVNFGGFSVGDASDSFTTRYEPGEGTVTITKLTTTEIVGTFSFTAYNDKGGKRTFTEGSFNVPYK